MQKLCFTFTHLPDAFIQSNFFLSLESKPSGIANATLYQLSYNYQLYRLKVSQLLPPQTKSAHQKCFGILQEPNKPTCAYAYRNHHSNECVRCSNLHQSKVISHGSLWRPGGHGACAKRTHFFSHFKCAEKLKSLGVTELKPQVTLLRSQRAELPWQVFFSQRRPMKAHTLWH